MDETRLQALLSQKTSLDESMQIRLTADLLAELDDFIESVNETNTNAKLNRSKVVRVALAAFLEGVRETV